jgi:hemerythrin-like domain-containing protein
MFDFMSKDNKTTQNAIALLKTDHTKVKELFEKFEEADDRKTKKTIVKKALEELSIHATIEEEIFYPAVRKAIEDEDGMMNEADEEHHVAKVLIAELEEMKGSESHYDAKFTVLAESVRHHIKEEENEMFPKAQGADIDFDTLGKKMGRRKEELMSKGVPAPAEATMVAKSKGNGDSPAKAAQRTRSASSKRGVKAGA